MKINHFCLFYFIPVISNFVSMLLFALISTNNNFNVLFVYNLGANFNVYTLTVLTILFIYFIYFIYLLIYSFICLYLFIYLFVYFEISFMYIA